MVCSAYSVEDLCLGYPKYLDLDFQKQAQLERIIYEIIGIRDSTAKILFDHDYFRKYTTGNLPDQILLVNGLALEASKLDDRYRVLSGNNFSDPNYKQLQCMLQGVKRVIQREIRYRQSQEA